MNHTRNNYLRFRAVPQWNRWTVETQCCIYALVGQEAADGTRRALANHPTELAGNLANRVSLCQTQTALGSFVPDGFFFTAANTVKEVLLSLQLLTDSHSLITNSSQPIETMGTPRILLAEFGSNRVGATEWSVDPILRRTFER